MDIADLDTLEAKLGREAMLALRDELLRRLPPEPSHPTVRPLSNTEKIAEAARNRFDAAHPPERCALHDRLAARAVIVRHCEQAGRFYLENYGKGGARLWRVMDRLTGTVALFALDDPRKPKPLQDYRSWKDADKRIGLLEDRFRTLGLNLGPLAPVAPHLADTSETTDLCSTVITDCLWLQLAPLLPGKPNNKRGLRPRVVSDRHALAAIVVYIRSNSVGWHKLPAELGCSPMLARKRLKEWRDAGVWPSVVAALRANLDGGGALAWERLEPDRDPLLDEAGRACLVEEIAVYLETHQITAGEISRDIFNHPGQVQRIMAGSGVRESTAKRIRERLAPQTVPAMARTFLFTPRPATRVNINANHGASILAPYYAQRHLVRNGKRRSWRWRVIDRATEKVAYHHSEQEALRLDGLASYPDADHYVQTLSYQQT